jgi:hypothetical protein
MATESGKRLLSTVTVVIITVLVTEFGKDIYQTAKRTAVGLIPTSSGPIAYLVQDVGVSVTAFTRVKTGHGFLFFGHTDYIVGYTVEVANHGLQGAHHVVMQFESDRSAIFGINAPPLSKAHMVGGNPFTQWSTESHDEMAQRTAVECELPPAGARTSFAVYLTSTTYYPTDEALSVQLALPNALVTAKGAAVAWH